MLFSKWIMTGMEEYTEFKELPVRPCICLNFRYTDESMYSLYSFVQDMTDPGTFTLLLSDKSFAPAGTADNIALDALITLFFQPSFYIVDNSPVIFTAPVNNGATANLLEQLKKKCLLQGFTGLTVLCPADTTEGPASPDAALSYYINSNHPDLHKIVENWTESYLKENKFLPVHFVITGNNIQEKHRHAESFSKLELSLSQAINYRMANKLYELQMDKHLLRQKIDQQKISEDNLRLYLEIQKKDLAKALDWYYYEHEILPLWYKQFGHIIKVIMGKRSFRSLFSDNVKKYKD